MLVLRARHCAALLLLTSLCVAAATPAPLRIGTSGDYPPFSMISGDGMRSGFDIDVSKALAPTLGRPLQFLPFRWPELSAGAKEGAFDLVASGVTIRPDRVLIGRFTRPYAVSEAVVLVRAQDAQRFHGLADLDREGIRVAVNRGGYLEGVARASFVHASIESVDDNRKLGEAVTGGAAEALVTDSIEAHRLSPLVRVVSLTRDRKAILVPRQASDGADTREMLAAIDGWLASHNSELETLRQRWFEGESRLDEPSARAEAIAALVDQRCGLAPWIAAYKRAHDLPIDDPERERKVLDAAAARARSAGLPPAGLAALSSTLIEASKDVQRAAGPIEAIVDLDTLRGILNELDDRLAAEISAARGLDAAAQTGLRGAVDALRWPGLTEARKREIADRIRDLLGGPS